MSDAKRHAELAGTTIMRLPVLGTIAQLDEFNHGDHAHIAPGVHLGGEVTIGEGTLVGIGSTVIPQRTVGAWSVIGAGPVEYVISNSDFVEEAYSTGLAQSSPGTFRPVQRRRACRQE